MEKHKDPEALWRAYSALAERCAHGPESPEDIRRDFVPAINVILSCLRAAGQACGPDYPES